MLKAQAVTQENIINPDERIQVKSPKQDERFGPRKVSKLFERYSNFASREMLGSTQNSATLQDKKDEIYVFLSERTRIAILCTHSKLPSLNMNSTTLAAWHISQRHYKSIPMHFSHNVPCKTSSWDISAQSFFWLNH